MVKEGNARRRSADGPTRNTLDGMDDGASPPGDVAAPARHGRSARDDRSVPATPPRRRRWLGRVLGLLAAAALGWALLAIGPALGVARDLRTGADAMRQGRAMLARGDLEGAGDAFGRGELVFARAREDIGGPVLGPTRVIPLLGRNTRTVTAIAAGGGLLATGARQVVEVTAGLPGGLRAFAPVGGAIPTEPIEALAPALAAAASRAARAEELLAAAPATWLAGPVAGARAEYAAALEDSARALRSGAALADALPRFLGADGPATYFFGAQNPAELRGTGGLLGSYAIVRISDGRLSFSRFSPVFELPNADVDDIEPPNPDYADRYDYFGGAGFWRNTNLTPDFPSAATAIARLYAATVGQRELDGVIFADPYTLAALLELSGPLDVPGYGEVTGGEMVDLLTNLTYAEFAGDNAERDRFFGDVAARALAGFLERGPLRRPAAAARTLSRMVGEGHLLLWSADPHVQAALETAGASGGLLQPEGDYLSVVGNNSGGNKLDYYAARRITYEIDLDAAGSAQAELAVELTNDAPDEGLHSNVIGPTSTAEAGENYTWFNVFTAPLWTLRGGTVDAEPVEVSEEHELGLQVLARTVRVPSRQSRTLAYGLVAEDAWEGTATGGSYHLTVQGQPTMRPTVFHLVVDVPDGMDVTTMPDGASVSDGRVTWEGELGTLHTFEVAFRPSGLDRVWQEVRQFLSQPLVHLG